MAVPGSAGFGFVLEPESEAEPKAEAEAALPPLTRERADAREFCRPAPDGRMGRSDNELSGARGDARETAPSDVAMAEPPALVRGKLRDSAVVGAGCRRDAEFAARPAKTMDTAPLANVDTIRGTRIQ